jgi:hypothetical protein
LAMMLVAAAITLTTAAKAGNEQVDCDVLIDQAHNTGTTPEVRLDPSWGVIRIITPERYCREPVERWRRRGLSWPVKKVDKSEAPQFLNLPKPSIQPEPEKQAAPKLPRAPVSAPLPPRVVKPQPIQPPEAQPETQPVSKQQTEEAPSPKPETKKPKTSSPTAAGTSIAPDLAGQVKAVIQGRLERKSGDDELNANKGHDGGFFFELWPELGLELWLAISIGAFGLGLAILTYSRQQPNVKEEQDGDEAAPD